MTEDFPAELQDGPKPAKKPKVFLLGEFSAGKSTLANALLGDISSPMRVTATQVPPIHYSFGDGCPIHIASDGTETEIPPGGLGDIKVDGTRAVHMFHQAKLLELVDLIDMPGSSDPNMAPDIWDALLPTADIVLWCTPATQAWRQSEAALWESMPERLHRNSLLLVTRSDTVRSDADRSRLLARVRRETEGLFHRVLPLAPVLALGASQDQRQASGLPQLKAELFKQVQHLGDPANDPAGYRAELEAFLGDDAALVTAELDEGLPEAAAQAEAVTPHHHQQVPDRKVVPRRIVRPGARRGGSGASLI